MTTAKALLLLDALVGGSQRHVFTGYGGTDGLNGSTLNSLISFEGSPDKSYDSPLNGSRTHLSYLQTATSTCIAAPASSYQYPSEWACPKDYLYIYVDEIIIYIPASPISVSQQPSRFGSAHVQYEPDQRSRLLDLLYHIFAFSTSYIFKALTNSPPHVILLSTLYLYFTGSFFFDIGHYTLHKFSKSKSRILRNIGYLHEVHHLYFNRRLKFNERYHWQNLFFELPLELSCQLVGSYLGYLIAWYFNLTTPNLLSKEILNLVLVFEIVRVVVVAILDGRDSNHQTYDTVVPKDPNSLIVGPQYHALHHINPSSYISASFRVFDWICGSSYSLRSRRVAMTGSRAGVGSTLKRELEAERVSCIHEFDLSDGKMDGIINILANTDILVIAHNPEDIVGSGNGNGTTSSTKQLIELFKEHYKSRRGHLLLPEVWYISSQPDLSHSPNFTNHARKYYDDEDILYRHIVTSPSSHSALGSEHGSPEQTVRVAMWWMRRGARYVPASCSWVAFLGYFKFLFWVRKAK